MLSEDHDKTRKKQLCHVFHTRAFCRLLLPAVLLRKLTTVFKVEHTVSYMDKLKRKLACALIMHFEKCNRHNISMNTKKDERQTAVINTVSFRISMNLTFRMFVCYST